MLEDTRPEYTASRLVRRCRLEATTSRLEDLASLATSYLPPSAQGSAAVPAPANANANAEPTPVPPPAPHAPPAPAPSPPPERLLGGNFASPPASSEGHEENRVSYQDDDDYGHEPRRVLKVCAAFSSVRGGD